jgi:hypothetical protein
MALPLSPGFHGLGRQWIVGPTLPPKEMNMLTPECLGELRSAWLPNMTDAGLERLISLLEKSSPLLIHGCFTRVVPMGCLASHLAWNHPRTRHLSQDAGITWLHAVAHLNPATSHVLRDWDRRGIHDLELAKDLLAVLRDEQELRAAKTTPAQTAELATV